MKKLIFSFVLLLVGMTISAQTVTGNIIDKDTNEPLIGASVIVQGTTQGSITDFNGFFSIDDVAANSILEISYLGYNRMLVTLDSNTELGALGLSTDGIGLQEVMVVADVAVDRKTPVAVSTIGTRDIEMRLGSQDIPELLKVTPSIYTTKSGGGYGDSRINVRGFNQRNTAVLINGIPVNDMENGWVYWSNWAGLGDVTRTMQVQRGLGASKLAISSVGGTINIVTKTTDQEKGGNAFVTYGNDAFLKAGFTLSTGKMDNGFAVTFSGSRTQGNGYIDGTYIDAWSYFLSAAKDFGNKHQLSFTLIGAPQKHGQRSFRENLTKYVAKQDGVSYKEQIKNGKVADFDERQEINGEMVSATGNVRYNSDWGFLNGERYNIRENFYHKPQMALNHYFNISDRAFLATSAYYSIGRGGGTGDRGSIGGRGTWGYRDDNGLIRVDDIVAWNSGNNVDGLPEGGKFQTASGSVATERDGLIKRASMNEHNWLGVLSKLEFAISPNLDLTTGIDVRQYRGLHYRKVVDLLGNDIWLDSRDTNDQSVSIDANGDGDLDRETGKLVGADDKLFGNPDQEGKIHYDNDGVVGWQGAFAELEWSNDATTFFVSGSFSNTSYKREDRFNYLEGSENEISETFSFPGYNLKAGLNYNLNDYMNVFVNLGRYSKAPTFDAIYPFFNNLDVNPDALNEKITGLEGGWGIDYEGVDINLNLYWTKWSDKTLFRSVQFADGTDGFANIQGLTAVHKGIEIEASKYIIDGLKVQLAASINDWRWQNDVSALIFDDDNALIASENIYSGNLKVGDAPQTQLYLGGSYEHDLGIGIELGYLYNAELYADFDPADRTDSGLRSRQALKLPSYGLLDGGLWYKFDVAGTDARIRFNMNNILDKLYVAEAFDASTLEDASGFFGFGRTWNVGLKVWF